MAEREGTPMKEAKLQGVLGTLWLVAKKTGADMQSFPIDADRVTIGRDWDSDIRLYFSDVSKLHCEIKFDLITGDASMHVHGTHGIRHAPQGGETTAYKPPSIIPLADRDTFIIRKKLFRFEYGHSDYLIDTPPMQTQPLPSDSPVKSASPAPAPRRKRVSHRMSLVPSGKNFEPFASPMKSRRHSIIGLGEGPQVIRTPKKSGLAQQIEEEEDEQEEEEEEEVVVEAVDGEEGDVLYVETREDDIKPVHSNPFMTPQQKGKAPMRNTSAVPRTRKLHFETKAPIAPTTVDGTASPQTPRSVPLPPIADTPYASAENTPAPSAKTPRSVPLPPTDNTPYKVTAQVAMSTPKGPVSLHKALLLRSARKAWQSSQAQGVDGAIVNGDVTTKRKSLSPKAQARKSLTPMPVPEEEEVSEEEEDEEDEEEGELQWVYEDGRASISIDESDSSIDSLEAEQSLDIPGQGVISFGTMTAEEAEEMEHNGASMEEESVEEFDFEGEFEAEEEQAGFDEEQEEEEEEEEAESMEQEQEQEQSVEVVTATPRRPLERFYTPQPQRTMAGGPRRSLADISGPAMRSSRQPDTPVGPVRRIPATPGSLGPPSRRVIAPVQDYEDEDEEEEVKPMPSTPARREVNPALLAEAKRRRETLGTPRALPSFPASFKTPVREVSLRGTNKTPSHPALEPTTPETDSPDREPVVPMTPLEKVQKELNALRRQSVQRQQVRNDAGRRATVSFALPSTPARPQPKASASYTVVGTRQQPRAFAITMEEDEESEPSTPAMAGQDVGEVSALHATPAAVEEEGEEDLSVEYIAPEDMVEPARTVPATPSFAGMKEMFRTAPVPPKTPSFSGIRSMFASPSQSAPTPRLDGVREMFHQPDLPVTPQMNGIRTMFALPREQGTPDMEGLKEMYEEDEVEEEAVLQTDTESEEDEVVEGYSEIIVVASPPKPKAAPIKKASTSAPSRSRVPAATVAKSTNTAPAAASRVPVASSSARTKATASSSASASASVAEKKAAPAVRKIPAPRARVPTKAEPAPKKNAATRAVARPRPGDIDDVSLSEIEEPLEYEEPVKRKAEIPKPQTTRTTGTRAKKRETVKAPAKSTSTASRTKKQILGENEEQHSTEVPAPAPAKATRAKKTIEKSTSAPSATAAAAKAASTSAPARRTRTPTVEKENEPEVKQVEPVKKAPVRRAVKKVAEPVAEPVVTTRTTRSRK